MALKLYSNNYTAFDFKKNVDILVSSFNEVNTSAIRETARSRLQTTINNLQKREQQIFDLLNVSNIDELRQRIRDYQKAVLKFSNHDLWPLIQDYRKGSSLEYNQFYQAVNYIFETEILNKIEEITPDKIANAYLDYLNDTFVGRKLSSIKALEFDMSGAFKRINTQLLTPDQLRVWKSKISDYINQKSSNKRGYEHQQADKRQQFYADIQKTTKESNNEDIITLGFTMGQKATANLTHKELDDYNKYLIEKISDFVDSSEKILIQEIIKTMVKKKSTLFTEGGENANYLTGVMGEIQGMYYMCKLFLGDKYTTFNIQEVLSTKVIWQGGMQTGDNSSKPHIDILLQGIGGLQVKNSTREFKNITDIGFREATIDYMFQKIAELSFPYFNDDVKSLIKTYYAMKGFNIPYTKEVTIEKVKKKKIINVHYKASSAPYETENTEMYITAREDLLNLEEKINLLLLGAAEVFMYLDTNKQYIKNTDLNVLFLVGGTAIYSAAEILEQMLHELDAELPSSFQVQGIIKPNITIVDALNDDTSKMTKSQKKKFQDKDTKYSYTDLIMENLYLTSSFNFSSLFNKS